MSSVECFDIIVLEEFVEANELDDHGTYLKLSIVASPEQTPVLNCIDYDKSVFYAFTRYHYLSSESIQLASFKFFYCTIKPTLLE